MSAKKPCWLASTYSSWTSRGRDVGRGQRPGGGGAGGGVAPGAQCGLGGALPELVAAADAGFATQELRNGWISLDFIGFHGILLDFVGFYWFSI